MFPGLGRLSCCPHPPMYCLSKKTDLLVQLVLTYTNTKGNVFLLTFCQAFRGFQTPLSQMMYTPPHYYSKCEIYEQLF